MKSHQRYYNSPDGDMHVWTKLHGNPSNSFWDILIWTKAVDGTTETHVRPQSHTAHR